MFEFDLKFFFNVVFALRILPRMRQLPYVSTIQYPKQFPHPVSSVNDRLCYDFSASLTKIEKQLILIN